MRSVSAASQFQLRQSPKMALGPTLRGLKRAAEAKKFERIAGRLAALARVGRDKEQWGLVEASRRARPSSSPSELAGHAATKPNENETAPSREGRLK